mmetsp:Transcript_45261/g.105626  ORF Transcript_45261/g.105626 Transcript_45261/m.105626 type:complete len:237 (-) Transcript_45261:194-904(-)
MSTILVRSAKTFWYFCSSCISLVLATSSRERVAFNARSPCAASSCILSTCFRIVPSNLRSSSRFSFSFFALTLSCLKRRSFRRRFRQLRSRADTSSDEVVLAFDFLTASCRTSVLLRVNRRSSHAAKSSDNSLSSLAAAHSRLTASSRISATPFGSASRAAPCSDVGSQCPADVSVCGRALDSNDGKTFISSSSVLRSRRTDRGPSISTALLLSASRLACSRTSRTSACSVNSRRT